MKSQYKRKQHKLHFFLFCLLVFFLIGQSGIVQPLPTHAATDAFIVEDDNWTYFKSKVEPPASAPIATIANTSSTTTTTTTTTTAANAPTLGPPASTLIASAEDFTIIVLPDTQFYSKYHPDVYVSQTQWIVDNQEALNIVYVAHEGDIVEDADVEKQWINADAAMSLLEDPVSTSLPDGIPYGVLPGNHDQPTELYNEYFGVSRFQGRDYYGGHYQKKRNDNNFSLFSASGMDFIVINIEYSPNDNVLAWADNLLQTYSDRRAIVVSHSLIDGQGNFTYEGTKLYEALKGNQNLFLMLAGHMGGEGKRMDVFNGNTIHTLLANYGSDGWLRILTFSPANNQIQVKTYSPYLDQFENDSDSEFTLYYAMAVDLAVSGNVSSAPVVAGNSLTYTLTVTNNGPLDATGVILADTLPADITFVSATPGSNCTESGGIVSCNLANLAAGDSTQVTIQVIVDAATRGTLTNTATVTGNEIDSNPANDTTIKETTVRAEADLAITETASSDPVVAGNSLIYTLTITNDGLSNATGVTLANTLPAGITFVSATPSSNCTESGGIVTCDLADLVVSDSNQVAIQIAVDASTTSTLTCIATISSNEPDPNTTNNIALQEIIVTALHRLYLPILLK